MITIRTGKMTLNITDVELMRMMARDPTVFQKATKRAKAGINSEPDEPDLYTIALTALKQVDETQQMMTEYQKLLNETKFELNKQATSANALAAFLASKGMQEEFAAWLTAALAAGKEQFN